MHATRPSFFIYALPGIRFGKGIIKDLPAKPEVLFAQNLGNCTLFLSIENLTEIFGSKNYMCDLSF